MVASGDEAKSFIKEYYQGGKGASKEGREEILQNKYLNDNKGEKINIEGGKLSLERKQEAWRFTREKLPSSPVEIGKDKKVSKVNSRHEGAEPS